MTSREQTIYEVGNLIYDATGSVDGDSANLIAEEILDAILPQVTTVAEIEQLPFGSWMIDTNGDAYRPSAPGYVVSDARGLMHLDKVALPLTVVWQPASVA